MHIVVLCFCTLCTLVTLHEFLAIHYVVLFIPCVHVISIKTYNLLYYYMIQQMRENIMAREVNKRILEEMFIQLLAKKANIVKDHLQNSLSQRIIVANIGSTMATFKFYVLNEEDSLKLHITLSNLGDIDEQIHQLWQQVNFLLQQYCSQCRCHYTKENNSTDI